MVGATPFSEGELKRACRLSDEEGTGFAVERGSNLGFSFFGTNGVASIAGCPDSAKVGAVTL